MSIEVIVWLGEDDDTTADEIAEVIAGGTDSVELAGVGPDGTPVPVIMRRVGDEPPERPTVADVAPPVLVRAYHNIGADIDGRHVAFLDGYQAGDPVVCVFTALAIGERYGSDLAACEDMFRLLNIGHDPDMGTPDLRAVDYRRRGNRSLSVGDVVAVDDRFYACAPVGFVPLASAPSVCVQTRYGTTPLP